MIRAEQTEPECDIHDLLEQAAELKERGYLPHLEIHEIAELLEKSKLKNKKY